MSWCTFWRTKSGMEINFVLGSGEVAVEVKGSTQVDRRAPLPTTEEISVLSLLHGLMFFRQGHKKRTSPARHTVHPDPAGMGLDNGLDSGQP